MKFIKKIGASLLVAFVVMMMAAPAALSLGFKDDVAGVPVVNPSGPASVRVLSEQESRSLNVLKAPNAGEGLVVGAYWSCTGDSEVTTICRISIVSCNDAGTICAETNP